MKDHTDEICVAMYGMSLKELAQQYVNQALSPIKQAKVYNLLNQNPNDSRKSAVVPPEMVDALRSHIQLTQASRNTPLVSQEVKPVQVAGMSLDEFLSAYRDAKLSEVRNQW